MKKAFAICLLIISVMPQTASAVTPAQKQVFDSGILYFNTEVNKSCASGGNLPTNLNGSDNLEKIFRFFVQKGLTPEQAAGITGNAQQESGANPLSQSKNYQGIFQWDKAGRWPRLVQSVTSKGQDPNTLEAQLAYAWEEATQRGNIDGIKSQGTNVSLAAWYWGRFFEVATVGGSQSTIPLTNVQGLEKRINYGEQALALYGSSANVATASSSLTRCSGGGQFINKFTFYNQYDPQWKDEPYGSSTIGEAGCGPTAMAMIISSLTDRHVTPKETAKYAGEQNLYTPGEGSKSSIGPILAAYWGLKAQPIGVGVAEISSALQAGKLIIVGGRGAVPFTSDGHIIVIRALTSDNKWNIGDPAVGLAEHSTANDQAWDPQQIVGNITAGTVYAISN